MRYPPVPDPRERQVGHCQRDKAGKGTHVYRMGALWPDGQERCIWCLRARGRRYKARSYVRWPQ